MTIFYTKLGRFEAEYYQGNIGEFHRIDGPAIEYNNGDKFWYQNGKWHRLDGPAVECYALERIEYWIKGKYYSKEEHEEIVLFYKEGVDVLL